MIDQGTVYDRLKATARALWFTRHARERAVERGVSSFEIAAAIVHGTRRRTLRPRPDRAEFLYILTSSTVARLSRVVAVPLRPGLVVAMSGDDRVITVLWSCQ